MIRLFSIQKVAETFRGNLEISSDVVTAKVANSRLVLSNQILSHILKSVGMVGNDDIVKRLEAMLYAAGRMQPCSRGKGQGTLTWLGSQQ